MFDQVTMVIHGTDGRNWLTGPPLDPVPRAGELIKIDKEIVLRVVKIEHSVLLESGRKHQVWVTVEPA